MIMAHLIGPKRFCAIDHVIDHAIGSTIDHAIDHTIDHAIEQVIDSQMIVRLSA